MGEGVGGSEHYVQYISDLALLMDFTTREGGRERHRARGKRGEKMLENIITVSQDR